MRTVDADDRSALVRNVTVRFGGERARSGPLTMAQTNMLLCILSDDPSLINVHLVWDVPDGMTVEAVADTMAVLFARHESLRTTYELADEPVQHIAAAGELRIAVHEAGAAGGPSGAPGDPAAGPPPDPAEFADDLGQRMRATRFDLAGEWPVRVAVVTAGGAPVHAVLAVCHLAMDAAAVRILKREWLALAAGRALPPPSPVRPLDLAESERSPEGLQRAAAALRYWQAQLLRSPQAMFAAPGIGETDWMLDRLRVRSRAAAAALDRITERTRASRSTVALAALCALIAYRTAQRTCIIATLSSNRFEPELRDYLGTIAQDALISADMDVASFDQAVRRVHRRALIAYPNSFFDATALWEMIDHTGMRRGTRFARDCVFNDLSVLPPDGSPPVAGEVPAPGAPEPDLRLTRLDPEPIRARLMLWVLRLEGEVDLTLCTDPQCLPAEEAERFGAGIARLLIEAADRDVPLHELAAIARVEPVSRGAGWLQVDGCWVELAEVDRLLADTLGERPFLVEPVPDERLGHRLVCHLAGDGEPPALELLHQALVGALPGRMSAMAPHEYVVRDRAPDERGDPAAWRLRPVVVKGDGRPEVVEPVTATAVPRAR